ncbi:MAG TPA: ABC transporter permease [bacterium]|nr:ABC transporter permease [bacterium]
MRLKTALELAIKSLTLNILRTSLTVLGVIIGVAAIVIVFAAGDGIRNLVTGEVASYGTDTIETEIKVPENSNAATTEVTTLKLDDMEAINKIGNVWRSYGVSLSQQKISWQSENKRVFLFGTSAAYSEIDRKSQPVEGRFFTEEEDRGQSMVVVLGYKLRQYLFGDQSAVGQWVKIGNSKFQVIGVLEERGGAVSMIDFDNTVFLPIKTLHKKILGIDYAMYLMHQLKDASIASETAEEIKLLMRERHDIDDSKDDDFKVTTMDELMDTLNVVTGAITWLLLAIVLISLIVGGVGIMNIMYVTVSERTPEIGLRKALGATYHDIVSQFLIESVLITFWGAIIGIVLGIVVAWLMSLLANHFGIVWNFSMPWSGILTALIFSLASGLLFGLSPAKKAAKLDPVEALRTE